MSAGRLEDTKDAVDLTREKWSDPLLGLAGGYACFAQGMNDHVRTVLGNLDRIDPALPDLILLQAGLDQRTGRTTGRTRSTLIQFEKSGGVPLFRWGVALGILAAEHYEVPGLAERLTAIDVRLVRESIWTMWMEESRPRLDLEPASASKPNAP